MDGCVGSMQKMMELMHSYASSNKSMPAEEVSKAMEYAQEAHAAMTGTAHKLPEPKKEPKKDGEPPARKAGVAYLDSK